MTQQIKVSSKDMTLTLSILSSQFIIRSLDQTPVSKSRYKDPAAGDLHHRSTRLRVWLLSGPRSVHQAVQPALRVSFNLSPGHQILDQCILQRSTSSIRGLLSMHICHDGAVSHRILAAFDVGVSGTGQRPGAGDSGSPVSVQADEEELLLGEGSGWS